MATKGISVRMTDTVGTVEDDVFARVGLIVGLSPAMRGIVATVRQVAFRPAATVLLQGESGTGKDVIARAIHVLSPRASYQFVAINCAAVPETLFETELFGVEAGAFTDAKNTRAGYLLQADGGEPLTCRKVLTTSCWVWGRLTRWLLFLAPMAFGGPGPSRRFPIRRGWSFLLRIAELETWEHGRRLPRRTITECNFPY